MLNRHLYNSLESSAEKIQSAIHWQRFEKKQLTETQAQVIRLNAMAKWALLPAVEKFLSDAALKDVAADSEFIAFVARWFAEEQTHALLLIDYLQRFWPQLTPTENELNRLAAEFTPSLSPQNLMRHFCTEVRMAQWFRCAANWQDEPVAQQIYRVIAHDESRQAAELLKFMKRALQCFGDEARIAFSKLGSLLAHARHCDYLYPADAGEQDVEWLYRRLDQQIGFDDYWEKRVSEAILSNLGALLDEKFNTAVELQKYRKTLIAAAYNQAGFY